MKRSVVVVATALLCVLAGFSGYSLANQAKYKTCGNDDGSTNASCPYCNSFGSTSCLIGPVHYRICTGVGVTCANGSNMDCDGFLMNTPNCTGINIGGCTLFGRKKCP